MIARHLIRKARSIFNHPTPLEIRNMIRSGWLAVLALVLVSLPCQAQFGGKSTDKPEKEWTVQVEMTGGQNVHGKIRLAAVDVTNELGWYEIKSEKVKTIRFPNPGAKLEPSNVGSHVEGTVVTTSGQEISGMVHVRDWKVETDLGTLKLNPKALKTVNFSANQSRPVGDDKEP